MMQGRRGCFRGVLGRGGPASTQLHGNCKKSHAKKHKFWGKKQWCKNTCERNISAIRSQRHGRGLGV